MKQLTLKDPKKLGENDPKYGQTYWAYTHDQEAPVMFNLMEGEVGEGSVISAETVELKTSKSGTEYHRLKKVKVLGRQQTSITEAKPSTSAAVIIAKLDEILALIRSNQPPEDKVVDVDDEEVTEDSFELGDEPIDLKDIPF